MEKRKEKKTIILECSIEYSAQKLASRAVQKLK